jgi:hypothetical protein
MVAVFKNDLFPIYFEFWLLNSKFCVSTIIDRQQYIYSTWSQNILSNLNECILVCSLDRKVGVKPLKNVVIVKSSLACLASAIEKNYSLIAIAFPGRNGSVGDGAIALCQYLIKFTSDRKTPILADVGVLRRDMALQIQNSGVQLMSCHRSGAHIDPENLMDRVLKNDPAIRIGTILARLCPNLNYIPVDDACELITCRGSKNRMVLGGKRLHEVCETDCHLHCEYFLRPGFRA